MGTFRHLKLWFHVVHELQVVVLFPEALQSIITAGDAIFLKSDLRCFGEKSLIGKRRFLWHFGQGLVQIQELAVLATTSEGVAPAAARTASA